MTVSPLGVSPRGLSPDLVATSHRPRAVAAAPPGAARAEVTAGLSGPAAPQSTLDTISEELLSVPGLFYFNCDFFF